MRLTTIFVKMVTFDGHGCCEAEPKFSIATACKNMLNSFPALHWPCLLLQIPRSPKERHKISSGLRFRLGGVPRIF